MRDSESGLERMSIGHHIGERGHVMERSRNRLTGDREERQDFFNLEESGLNTSFSILCSFSPWTASSCLNFILNLCGKICPIHYCKTLSLSGEAAAFDEEWRRELGRYRPSNARSLDYGRDRSAGVGQQLALTAPPSSSSSPSPRHESPRHHPPHSRPRYDWWEVWIFQSLNESCLFGSTL